MTLFARMLPLALVLGTISVLGLGHPDLLRHAAISILGTGAGLAWIIAGVRRHRPQGRIATLLLGAAALNCAAMIAWYAPVLAGGDATLAQPSIADALWLVADPLLGAALLYALTRRERPLHVILDVLTIAAALALIAGVTLIGPDLATSIAPAKVRMTQLCYVVSDLFVLSAALRVILAPRGRPPALWLLAAAGVGLVWSDFAWNWLTISGDYMPGTWADVGWIVQPLLLGLAALHPSLRGLGTGERPADADLRPAAIVVLAGALLVAPLALGSHAVAAFVPDVDDAPESGLAVMIGGTLLAALVVTRFLLLLRRTRALADAAAIAAHRTESRYRTLIEQNPAIIVVFEIDEGGQRAQPVYVSPQTEIVLGIPAETWIEDYDSVLALIHPEDGPTVVNAFQQAVATGSAAPIEFRALRADGDEIWLGDAGAVRTVESGVRYVQTMLFDITHAKRAQAERETIEQELRLSQKLEAVGQLAAGIAHEINTPTQFVGDTVGFLREAFEDMMALHAQVRAEVETGVQDGTVSPELLDRVRDAEETADLEYLRERVPAGFERAEDGVRRVGAIVGAMREFAHPTADKAPQDLNAALRNTLVVASSEYKYVAELETDFGDLPPVLCNGGDIKQVFLNLIVNAAHAIEEAGSGEEEARGTIRIRTRAAGDHVLISIADTGCGIPADVADRIFDPFFTTKEVGRGTGQGLAIARTLIVERHGGSLTFETASGEGTTFHVRLPIGGGRLAAQVAA
jgi:PAS domain S-box-containing protein